VKRKRTDFDDPRGGPRTEQYAWLRGVETPEEKEARRRHRPLPPLPADASPQQHHLRQLRGGRGRKRGTRPATLEQRARMAYADGVEKLLLRKWEIAELVAIYDRIELEDIPNGRWLRATLLAMADGVEKAIEELPGKAERLKKALEEIRDQAKSAAKGKRRRDGKS
jgi:hypothetical protein